jgi:hypothetical protein
VGDNGAFLLPRGATSLRVGLPLVLMPSLEATVVVCKLLHAKRLNTRREGQEGNIRWHIPSRLRASKHPMSLHTTVVA